MSIGSYCFIVISFVQRSGFSGWAYCIIPNLHKYGEAAQTLWTLFNHRMLFNTFRSIAVHLVAAGPRIKIGGSSENPGSRTV